MTDPNLGRDLLQLLVFYLSLALGTVFCLTAIGFAFDSKTRRTSANLAVASLAFSGIAVFTLSLLVSGHVFPHAPAVHFAIGVLAPVPFAILALWHANRPRK